MVKNELDKYGLKNEITNIYVIDTEYNYGTNEKVDITVGVRVENIEQVIFFDLPSAHKEKPFKILPINSGVFRADLFERYYIPLLESTYQKFTSHAYGKWTDDGKNNSVYMSRGPIFFPGDTSYKMTYPRSYTPDEEAIEKSNEYSPYLKKDLIAFNRICTDTTTTAPRFLGFMDTLMHRYGKVVFCYSSDLNEKGNLTTEQLQQAKEKIMDQLKSDEGYPAGHYRIGYVDHVSIDSASRKTYVTGHFSFDK